jgi:hypothetical protein
MLAVRVTSYIAGIQLMVNAFNKPSSMIHNSNMAALRTFDGKITLSLFTIQGPGSI